MLIPKVLVTRREYWKSNNSMPDRACTGHICNDWSRSMTFEAVEATAQVGNQDYMEAEDIGSIRVETAGSSKANFLTLQDFLFIPSIRYNLI